jgi:hypothetical protein
MLAQERIGNRAAAAGTARRLLEHHATSIYANSHTRRLARPDGPITRP